MKPGVAARLAAARALGRVARNGAYSNRVMGPESTDLSPRDARLTRYLGYGAIRYLLRVDRAVAAASSRPLDQIQDALLDALRIGAFELLFSSADQHGVVDSGAEAVRHAVGERAVGFANAVLRRVARDGEPPIPDWDRALRYGVPGWMYERVGDGLGPEAADAFFAGANEEPPVGIWAPDGLADAIASTPAAGIPGASYLDDGADVTAALGGGAMVVDPASTAVALAVQAQPGDFVLDMAAAPGNKTAQIWHAMAGEGRLVALDRNLLLDAPCSGLGTLRRRPEIRHRLDEGSPLRMSLLQRELLASGLAALKPGGRLVYSVCTVFCEETIDIVADLPARAPEGLPGTAWGNGLLLGPHLTGTDGMFISVVEG